MKHIETLAGIKIIQLENESEALPYRASFAGAYQTIFSEPPYSERFYPSEAQAVLAHSLQVSGNLTLLAIKGKSKVVGFAFAIPVGSRPEIAKELRGLIPIKNSIYLSELGVREQFRRKGLARKMTQLRLTLIDTEKFTHAVMRTSIAKDPAYSLFMNLGFEDMGVYTEVSARRIDGGVRTDRRLFLSRMIEEPERFNPD